LDRLQIFPFAPPVKIMVANITKNYFQLISCFVRMLKIVYTILIPFEIALFGLPPRFFGFLLLKTITTNSPIAIVRFQLTLLAATLFPYSLFPPDLSFICRLLLKFIANVLPLQAFFIL
jgi:hypothetical protein